VRDLHATLLPLLDIDHEGLTISSQGRDFRSAGWGGARGRGPARL